jgi:CheY-like chemotaxis protein
MRLNFNVLWVEDQIKYVESIKERISLLLDKEGFNLQVLFADSVENAKINLSDDIYGDHIDLILMDYDLGSAIKGDTGLEEVRRIFPYKDIVFYSSQAEDLAELVANKKIEGIFCSTRQDIADTVEKIFEVLVKKVLDIEHSRGIVMGATSDIDQFINDCLVLLFDESSEDSRNATLQKASEHIEKKKIEFDENIEKLKKIDHVSELCSCHSVYTSNDRVRLFLALLKSVNYSKEITEGVQSYLKIIPLRNILAHVRVVTNGFSRKLINNKGKEFTYEDAKLLRINLLKHHILFENLHKTLNNGH